MPRLGGADVARGVWRGVCERQRGAVDQRPGQLDRDVDVGQLVFYRLVQPIARPNWLRCLA
jgi:hypothetical protein